MRSAFHWLLKKFALFCNLSTIRLLLRFLFSLYFNLGGGKGVVLLEQRVHHVVDRREQPRYNGNNVPGALQNQ